MSTREKEREGVGGRERKGYACVCVDIEGFEFLFVCMYGESGRCTSIQISILSNTLTYKQKGSNIYKYIYILIYRYTHTHI